MFRKSNLIVVGFLLLLVFALAVWLVGRQIDTTVNAMHHSMVRELGQYRSELIQQDFRKTGELETRFRDFLEEKGYDKKELTELLAVLVKLDEKVSRGWFTTGKDTVVCTDSTCEIQVSLPDLVVEGSHSCLYRLDSVCYWTICGHSQGVTYGFDIGLDDLHTYFSHLIPARRNYAYILNADGILIAHPDERLIGKEVEDSLDLIHLHKVLQGERNIQVSGFSRFLLLPVEKLYYPITAGSETWVVVVNVVQLDNEESMTYFHRYTLFIVIITVLIFCTLLAYSQYRWRKEYDLRKKAEQEAMRLNMQQLKNQLNPHFLFNSLNSLSVLIGTDQGLARKFVLELSKVYRYVLEKRNENLVSVKEELDFTRHYYFLQKIRFGEQLNLKVADGLEVLPGKIPAMSLQLLFENAVKHNEITRQFPLEICITTDGEDLIVMNTFSPRADVTVDSMGVGLKSISEIYSYYSVSQRFMYRVEQGKFIVHLPILKV